MDIIKNQASGVTGVWGLAYSGVQDPREWLLYLSAILIIVQLCHWAYRLFKWIKGN